MNIKGKTMFLKIIIKKLSSLLLWVDSVLGDALMVRRAEKKAKTAEAATVTARMAPRM